MSFSEIPKSLYFRCPTTGQILQSSDIYDDKVICPCGKTNPAVARQGHEEDRNLHLKRFLATATKAEYEVDLREMCEKEKAIEQLNEAMK